MIYINISKTLLHTNVAFKLSFLQTIQTGEFIAIMGKSGSGKTTLLRIIAGLEKAKGDIKVQQEIWQSDRFFLPPQKRSIGYVAQSYALFENMNVLENLLYANNDKELANYLLHMVELQQYKYVYPKNLSGGQKQRVALARALMRKPKLLLLDEPLSALDEAMRLKLQEEIKTLHKEFGTTTIMVTHDKAEAFIMANRVIELENGLIQKEIETYEAYIDHDIEIFGKIVEIKQVDILTVAVVYIYGKFIEITLSNEQKQQVQVGKRIKIRINRFSLV